jgi:hypothetical protein
MAARCPRGGDGLWQQHHQGDDDTHEGLRKAGSRHPASMAGDSTFANPTTATSPSDNMTRLITADLSVGGSACVSSS